MVRLIISTRRTRKLNTGPHPLYWRMCLEDRQLMRSIDGHLIFSVLLFTSDHIKPQQMVEILPMHAKLYSNRDRNRKSELASTAGLSRLVVDSHRRKVVLTLWKQFTVTRDNGFETLPRFLTTETLRLAKLLQVTLFFLRSVTNSIKTRAICH